MSGRLSTAELQKRFLAALGSAALLSATTDAAGELVVELRPPLPRRTRVYIYNATNPPGGRPTPEHKIQLILTGQQKGERCDFDWSGVDLVLLCGYVVEHDIFVLWDASLHTDFPHSKNVQVRTANVLAAAASGVIVHQARTLATGPEVVICTPIHLLPVAIAERASMGGIGSLSTKPTVHHGQSYMRPPRNARATPKSRVFHTDPDAIDRGTKAHMDIQDQLADAVSARGWQPLSPSGSDPLFDVAWVAGDAAWITEVKSLTADNEERQLRLGLGQVLSYSHLVDWDVSANQAVLAVEREPSSAYWFDLCDSHGVVLSWPEVFDSMLDACG